MKPRVLLVGYNGANNTGAEEKFLVMINEIRLPNWFEELADNVETLFSDYGLIKSKLQVGYEEYRDGEGRNPVLLRTFLEEHYPEWLG